MTGGWLDERIREIRARVTRRDEASLWVLLFDDPSGSPLVAQAFDGAMNEPPAGWLPNFVSVLEQIGATAYLLAVIRHNGRPLREDRQLWGELQLLLRDCEHQMLGLLVVGAHTHWFAPSGNAPAAA